MKKSSTAFKGDEVVRMIAVEELTLEEARKSRPIPKQQDQKALWKKIRDAMKK